MRDPRWLYALIVAVGITTVVGMVMRVGQLAGWW